MPIENQNDRAYLDRQKQTVLEYLRMLKGAPNVQMQEVPPDLIWHDEDEGEENPDQRGGGEKGKDRRTERDGELYDHDGY